MFSPYFLQHVRNGEGQCNRLLHLLVLSGFKCHCSSMEWICLSRNVKDVEDLKTSLGGILCLLMRCSGPESRDARGDEASVASGMRRSSHRGGDGYSGRSGYSASSH